MIELDVLDAIGEVPGNQGKDLSVIDLARRDIRAAGLEIPSLDSLASGVVTEYRGEERLALIVRLGMAVCVNRRQGSCWTSS